MSTEPELIAVDGADTFLGRAIVKELIARKKQVRSIALAPDAATPEGSETTIAPLGDEEALGKAVEGTTSLVMARKLLEENPAKGITFKTAHTDRTRQLLAAAEKHAVKRFIYIGLAAQRNGTPATMFKAEAEIEGMLDESRAHTLYLATSLVVGKGDGHVSRLAAKAKRPGPLALFVGQGWARSAPITVRDFGRCIAELLLAQEFRTGGFSIGGRERLTAMEMFERLLLHYGRSKVNVHILESIARASARLLELVSARPPVTIARLSWLLEDRTPGTNIAPELLGRFPRKFESAFAREKAVAESDAQAQSAPQAT